MMENQNFFRVLKEQNPSDSYECDIGIDQIAAQLVREVIKKDIHFNILIIGKPGTGKSSIIRNILQNDYNETASWKDQEFSLRSKNYLIRDGQVSCNFNITETINYSYEMNSINLINKIKSHILDELNFYAEKLVDTQRNISSILDNRNHLCIFVVDSVSNGLKPLDVCLLKEISWKTNLIVIIGKADTLTEQEISELSEKVLSQIRENDIQLYTPIVMKTMTEEKSREYFLDGSNIKDFETSNEVEYSDNSSEGEHSESKMNSKQISDEIDFKTIYPLKIITSTSSGGEKSNIRLLSYADIDVNNPKYSDLNILKDIAIRDYMYDMIDLINTKIFPYEFAKLLENNLLPKKLPSHELMFNYAKQKNLLSTSFSKISEKFTRDENNIIEINTETIKNMDSTISELAKKLNSMGIHYNL